MIRTALAAAVLAAGTVAASSTLYVGSDAALKTASGAALGTVTPGTAVNVVTTSSNVANVQIDGWQPVGSGGAIYAGVDSRVVLVRLANGASLPDAAIVAKQNDAYGSAWNHVRLAGTIALSTLVPDAATVWQSAATLYGQRCSACHTLHQPSEFTANQWPGAVAAMAHNASLTPAQQDLIVRYLQAHASDAPQQ